MTNRDAAARATFTSGAHQRIATRAPRTTLLDRLLARLSAQRCRSRHYSAFLQRHVRCRAGVGPHAVHRFRAFDETVEWR